MAYNGLENGAYSATVVEHLPNGVVKLNVEGYGMVEQKILSPDINFPDLAVGTEVTVAVFDKTIVRIEIAV